MNSWRALCSSRPRFALALLLISLALSCRRFEERAEPRADVPVFIISIDTLRSDRLPAYGYGKGSTPAIDAFRKDAILFRHAFSPCPLTLPSHASLFTGEPPYIHGLRNNLGYTLEPSHRSLASVLKEKGYETGGAVSTFVLRKETGIAAGFDFYDDFMTHSPLESATSWQRDGDLSRQALSTWIETTHSTKVFGFLHLYEPHSPYSAPTAYSDNRDPYDGEVSYADAIAGRFLDELKKRGLYDSALVIVLSDHGEGLGDHGEKEHGIFLYRESLQVPLLVKLPGGKRAGESVDRTVALTDVVPTVMEVVGIEGHSAAISLLAAAPATERHVYSETYYPRLQYGWSELLSMIGTDLHYIHAPKAELYRYRVDGAERQNVVAESRRGAASFRQELRKISDGHPFAQPRAADPEDAKKLAALGYVGSTVSASGVLPDPKDKLDVLRAFGSASDHFRSGQYAKAAAMMEELMRANPDFISGWGLLAESYRKLGRQELALETLRIQMNHSPGNSQVALSLADLLREMGRYREAREHALLAKESGAAFVHETLAMIALAENDLEQADREAVASLASEPDRIQALMLRSQIRRLRKRPAEELAFLEKASEVVRRRHLPAIRDLEFRRGEALLQRGRVPQAEQAFRAETIGFPSHLKAWANLALMVGVQGRRAEARSILDEAMRRNPGREVRKLAVETLLTMNDREGAREVAARSAR
ncbi:MAG: sulfatase-like hydrolase/transferase [Thermoanaerobaculia bacterium]